MKTTNKLLIAVILVIALTSCGVSKITVAGQYGDYSFTPRKVIVIEEDSK